MRIYRRSVIAIVLSVVVAAGAGVLARPQAQPFDKLQRARAKKMLAFIKQAIETNYYDPAFHGVDLNTRFKKADQDLDGATSFSFAYATIAQALLDFNDSHLYFVPPMRPSSYEYGWTMEIVGDKCLVMAVKPGSDAEKKGLKAGDTILTLEAFTPTRNNFFKLRYLYYTLSPRDRLKLSVQSPGGQPRDLEITAKVTPKPADVEVNIFDERTVENEAREEVLEANRSGRAGNVAIWKLSSFVFDPGTVDRVFDAITKGADALVIDMRGNGGGYVDTMQRIMARLFDHDVTVATLKMRKSTKAMTAKAKKPVFAGKVVLIVDSESASAAEILSRAFQLETRATVIGDQSAGAVMQAQFSQDMLQGLEGNEDLLSGIPYGASVTNADVIMKDGKSLEHVGVTPDEVLLPKPEDLAASLDTVLARAVAAAGGSLDPAAAGKLFPIKWKK